jgi:nuclear pore complex protein Nup50
MKKTKLKRWEHSQWPVMKNRAVKKAELRNVEFESDSGGAFKGFKGLVVPSVGGGFSGFGGSGGKPLEGLTNGNSTDNATPLSSVKMSEEPKAAFGSFAVNDPTTFVDTKISSPKCNSSNQPHSSGPASSTACTGNAYHKQLAGLNCSIWD